jgi:hypothetical protein
VFLPFGRLWCAWVCESSSQITPKREYKKDIEKDRAYSVRFADDLVDVPLEQKDANDNEDSELAHLPRGGVLTEH